MHNFSTLKCTPLTIRGIYFAFSSKANAHSFYFQSTFSKRVIIFLIIAAWSIFPLANGWAWEVNTHEELTEQAIQIMEADLNNYLINNLGLEGGLNEALPGGTPKELMIQGSASEDNIPRFFRHFHEPISNAGLAAFDSAIIWALRPIGGQGGDAYSWNDAREYYFRALTSPTKAERDENWGKTFRALGQVMHLLQDSANPSHVRDDLHPFDDGLHDYMAQRSVGSFIGGGIFSPDPSMLKEAGTAGPNNEPFANLFDRETYQGSAPEATLGTDIGVTEYTNANFFSDDTIPGQGSIFSTEITHPTVAELVPAPVPSPYLTLPRLGSAAFPGARAAKLTGNQAAAKFLLTNTNLDLLGQLQLDDAVYEGQSINLLPRAVGYSAAVLTYFFRPQYTLEPSDHEFQVLGDPPTNEVCEGPPDANTPGGDLDVRITIPSDLNFSDGTASIYYEKKSDGSRVLAEQFDFPRSFPPFEVLSFGVRIPHADVPDPFRWIVVLEGMAGPGTQEERAILANTEEEAWVFMCTN